MNVYVWPETWPITHYVHDGGAVLVVAASLDRAREMWREHVEKWRTKHAHIYDDLSARGPQPDALDEEPGHVLPTTSTEELLLVFPDAGCC